MKPPRIFQGIWRFSFVSSVFYAASIMELNSQRLKKRQTAGASTAFRFIEERFISNEKN